MTVATLRPGVQLDLDVEKPTIVFRCCATHSDVIGKGFEEVMKKCE